MTTKEELLARFYDNHKELLDYVDALDDDAYLLSVNEKWTAGQQLAHVQLCLLPIHKALESKEYIKEKFGVLDRPARNYDELIAYYKEGLNAGGKAPERFLPEAVALDNRAQVSEDLMGITATVQKQLEDYTEEELDTLVLPHPFLGMLSLRELFFLMTYHATHHLRQVQDSLVG
jgi:hypothetical protein